MKREIEKFIINGSNKKVFTWIKSLHYFNQSIDQRNHR